jgi:hypothetical protein
MEVLSQVLHQEGVEGGEWLLRRRIPVQGLKELLEGHESVHQERAVFPGRDARKGVPAARDR